MDQAQFAALSYRAQQREEWLGSIAERLRSADFQLRRSTGERLFLDELVRALDNGRDMLILGNTGSGKSWLLLKLLQQVARSSIVVRDSQDGDSEAKAALTGRPAEVIGYTNKTVESSMIGNFGLIALEDFTIAPQLVGQLRSQESSGSRVGLVATSQEALNRSQGIAESLGLRDPITVGLSFRMDRGFFSGRLKHSYLGTVYGL